MASDDPRPTDGMLVEIGPQDDSEAAPPGISERIAQYHARIPYLGKMPFRVVSIILILIMVNLVAWAAIAVVLVGFICSGAFPSLSMLMHNVQHFHT
jgi:hypothetical protein